MERKSTDRRVRYTKLVLKQTLMKMLQEKPVKKISTSELCRRADISRNTFYTYYRDPEELLQILMDNYSEQLYKTVMENLNVADISEATKAICTLVAQEPELSKWLLTHLQNSKFVLKILNAAKEQTVAFYRKEIPELSDRNLEFLFNYMAYGTLHILLSWVEGGLVESVDSTTKQITQLNKIVVTGVIKQIEDER